MVFFCVFIAASRPNSAVWPLLLKAGESAGKKTVAFDVFYIFIKFFIDKNILTLLGFCIFIISVLKVIV